MTELVGKGIGGGIAEGKVVFYRTGVSDKRDNRASGGSSQNELEKFRSALSAAISENEQLYESTLKKIGEEQARLFEVHTVMMKDAAFCSDIEKMIIGGHTAQDAVAAVCERLAGVFMSTGDDYMRSRAEDVRDISLRIMNFMGGQDSSAEKILPDEGKVILCAETLTPSQTVKLDKKRIAAFVIAKGSFNSHTAILARGMGIPAVLDVGNELFTCSDGDYAVVDGNSGRVYVAPEGMEYSLREMVAERADQEKERYAYIGCDNVTKDGRRIELFANIGSCEDADFALENDAGGIGLFRSEFLFIGREDFPSEEEQFSAYRSVLEKMNGKKVIIRTLDIGADKHAEYFNTGFEENPAMGMRGIRLCLSHPEIFETQLRAMLRASAYGNLSILFPLVSSVKEVVRAKEYVTKVKKELNEKGIKTGVNVEIGVMVETPAAALISDMLAEYVDFFSVGTNDLSQYTLAVDRQNGSVSDFYDPHHEAILRLIEMTVRNAHEKNIWVGICGELGSDDTLTERFLRMGIDELSVSPPYILPLRGKIRKLDLRRSGVIV